MEVGQGATVSVTVAATSEGGELSYQWSMNGVDIDGGTSDTLTLTNVSDVDEGTYSVSVSVSQLSTTSDGATLSVSK